MALRSLDTGWRSAILAPLASDAGRAGWAAPRWQQQEGGERRSLSLPLGERRGQGASRSVIKSPKPLADRPARKAFTLVELLVVIVIIAMLAALVTPAVFNARRSAQNAAIKAEIDMLHMAIMHYKNEYGSFPPCADLATARNHVRRIFPRTANINAQVPAAPTPETSLYFWLQGYTKDPTAPLQPGSRAKLYDFDQSRVTSLSQYHPTRKPGSPYVYINSGQYFTAKTATSYTPRTYVQIQSTEDQNGNFSLDTGEDANSNAVLDVTAFNADTFQILSAGLDETFGTEDDLSNFWKGTRQDYLDSL